MNPTRFAFSTVTTGPKGHTRGHRSAQSAHRGPVGTQRPKGHTEAQRDGGPRAQRGLRGTEAQWGPQRPTGPSGRIGPSGAETDPN